MMRDTCVIFRNYLPHVDSKSIKPTLLTPILKWYNQDFRLAHAVFCY